MKGERRVDHGKFGSGHRGSNQHKDVTRRNANHVRERSKQAYEHEEDDKYLENREYKPGSVDRLFGGNHESAMTGGNKILKL